MARRAGTALPNRAGTQSGVVEGGDVGSGRIARRDRDWLPKTQAFGVGPLRAPDVNAVVAAIARVARAFPTSRLGWSLSDDCGRWRWDPTTIEERAARMVTAVDRPVGADLAGALDDMVARPDLAWPIAFLIGDDHVLLRHSHGVGDGRTTVALLAGVIEAATTRGLPSWSDQPEARYPLPEALVNHFGKEPARLRAALAQKRASSADRRDAPLRAAARGDGSWTPRRRTEFALLPRATWKIVRDWRRDNAPYASNAALATVLLVRALAQEGLDVAPDVLVLRDLRRYLPRKQVWGNFVIGLDVPVVAGPCTGRAVTELSQRLGDEAISGRPLLAAAAGVTTGLLRSSRPAEHLTDAYTRQVRLAVSSVGRPRPIEMLPWEGATAGRFAGSLEPIGRSGLSVGIDETGHQLQFSASFHDGQLPAGAVARALQRLTIAPLDVLAGPGGPA